MKKLMGFGGDDLLKQTPLDFETILDIGIGNGAATEYFINKGKGVTGIGLNLDSYDLDPALKNKSEIIECDLFSDKLTGRKFDAIWFCHCLEHIFDMGKALKICNDLLNENGWLFILVPPYTGVVLSGHYNTGWDIVQLIYVLMHFGFDTRNGHYIQHAWNICGFVRKNSSLKLPKLRYDGGDLTMLKEFFPPEINVSSRIVCNINKINWVE